MSRPCRNVEDIVSEVRRIIETEKSEHPEDGAEFYFRGESANFKTMDNSEVGTHFTCSLYQPNWQDAWKVERDMYEEALRLKIFDFDRDRTMSERIVRMQHYQLLTRFCDLSDNCLQSASFATGAGSFGGDRKRTESLDGWVRIIKVSKKKMKSFTSDIIVAISHLPLVDCEDVHLSGPLAKTDETSEGLNVLRYEIMKERPAFGFEFERPVAAPKLRCDIQKVWPFKPKVNNPRIDRQGGIFLAFGCGEGKTAIHPTFAPEDYDDENAPSCGIKQVGAVRIAAESKYDIEDELRYYGVRGEQVYPELSEVCQQIKCRLTRTV